MITDEGLTRPLSSIEMTMIEEDLASPPYLRFFITPRGIVYVADRDIALVQLECRSQLG